jgi:exodeoxyribonuclease VII large subunit
MNFEENDTFENSVYSVSELTNEIKLILETSIPSVWVEGEISNFTHHQSGHIYFSLKDEKAQIAAVMWRNRNQMLFFAPQNGMKVRALGNVRVYEKRGNYQLDVIQMLPVGIGELQLAFERLKTKLHDEGLFDPEHKKPLPEFPSRIGIVTSPTGAAIRDIVDISTRRFPAAQLVLRPAKVQGEGAAQDIAAAIDEMNEYGEVDVLIVGRGGGSLEDLWAFNEEIVARAIFRSEIPVVSAVGHEIDFTISDFVADLRAPTPSAAAELVLPNKEDIEQHLRSVYGRMHSHVKRSIDTQRSRVEYLFTGYAFRRPVDVLKQHRQRLDDLLRLCQLSVNHQYSLSRRRLDQLQQQLAALNPHSILRRGYSICWKEYDNSIVTDASTLEAQEKIGVRFSKGSIKALVSHVDRDNHLPT